MGAERRSAGRPQHAQPSLLAPPLPSRAGVIRTAIVSGLVAGACAAVAGGLVAAAAVRPAAAAAVHGAAARSPSQARPSSATASTGVPSALSSSSATPTPTASGSSTADGTPASALAASGIPSTALDAYTEAANREALRDPGCALGWPLLAGIGRVESNHGRFAGAVLHADGLSTPPVVGIALDGHGTALIRDTDHGRLDGDTVYDRAVGPMQFIPSTWVTWGVDANGDGVKDPFNIFDAAAAAADYLCAAGRNLGTTAGQVQAILSYNHSYDYVSTVMAVEALYARGVGITVPVLTGPSTPPAGPRKGHRQLPPVDPGTPRGLGTPPAGTPPPHTTSAAPSPSASWTHHPTIPPSCPPTPAGTLTVPQSVPDQPSGCGTDAGSDTPSATPATSPTSPAPAATTPSDVVATP